MRDLLGRWVGRRRRSGFAAATLLAVAGLGLAPAESQALRVTVGTPTAAFGAGMSLSSCSSCTQFQQSAPGYTLSVAASGVITAWRVAGRGPLALRVLRPSGGVLSAVASSAPQSPGAGGPSTFSTSLPVSAGDQIGVDLLPTAGKSAQVRLSVVADAVIGQAVPAAGAGGAVSAGSTLSGVLNLNADVEVAPVATGLDLATGPTTGGTAVTISGTYLDGVTQIRFGGTPAGFSLGPAGVLLVRTPPRSAPGAVDVQVQGAGGTSTLGGAFTYLAPPPAPPGQPAPTPVIGPPAGGSIVAPPAIRDLSLSPVAFRTAGAGTTGTRIVYSDTAAATTRFGVLHLVPGRLVPGRAGRGSYCQPTNARVAAAVHCVRYRPLGTSLSHRDRAGVNVVAFSGRLGTHAIPPGPYRLTAVATDALGRRSPAVTHAFRVLPAR